jgi:flavin-dependent dehydrogenase
VAALILARAGVSVRLVDRARFPRPKLCGDTVNPGALSILDRLGIGAAVRAHARPCTGMVVTGPGGATVTADYPLGIAGAAVERSHLDLLLLDAAVAAGADFTPGVKVVAPTIDSDSVRVNGVRIQQGCRTGEVKTGLVIAADGRHSKLATLLGLTRFARRPKRWAFGAYFADVEGLTARGEMHVGIDGYTGVAPLAGGLANVCVVRELKAPWPHACRADEVIRDALAGNAGLRQRFARARQVSGVTTLGPLAVDTIAAGSPGLLLAGDAAGFVDPITGDGLRFAFRGGELAAAAALAELEGGPLPAHERLRTARAREFSGKWRFNRALRSLIASPRGITMTEALLSWWPAPVSMLVGIAGDVHLARG